MPKTDSNESDVERRSVTGEVRAMLGNDGLPRIVGVAPAYNAMSDVITDGIVGFREIIEPHALDDILANADVRGRYNHEAILGRTKSGTMTLRNSDTGLTYEIQINPNDSEAMAAYEKVKRGDVDGSSFMFVVPKNGDTWKRENGQVVRRVQKIEELLDVGPVDFPAYPQTSVSARSKYQELTETPEDGAQTVETPPEGQESADEEADKIKARARLDLLRKKIEIAEKE